MGQKVLKGSGFQPRATEDLSFQKGVAHVGTLFGHKGLQSMVTFDELFVFLITWGNLVPTWVWGPSGLLWAWEAAEKARRHQEDGKRVPAP